MGSDLWSTPADELADEVAEAGSGTGDSGPGRSAARDQWSAWAPNVPNRPGSPSAGDEDRPDDHADGSARAGASASALGDTAADGPGTADVEKQADIAEEEVEEE